MQVSVHDTKEEYEAIDPLILASHLEVHNDEPYKTQTLTRPWAYPRERLDGKWTAPVCDHYDYTGIITEEDDPANYPVIEDDD
jgi:hypothetical protein